MRGILSQKARPTLKDGELPITSIDCPHGETCSGCPHLGVEYTDQLLRKRAAVVDALSRYPTLEFVYTSPVELADPIVEYRARARLFVASDGSVGLPPRESSGVAVVDIPQCRVLSPTLKSVVDAVRELIAAADPTLAPLLRPFAAQGVGGLRALELREVRPKQDGAEPRALLTLVLQRDRAPAPELAQACGKALLERLETVIGLALRLHERDPGAPSGELIHLGGAEITADAIGDAAHLATFGTFLPVHREQADRLTRIVRREVVAIDPDRQAESDNAPSPMRPVRVLDLYAGTGILSLSLAHARCAVTSVESSSTAAACTRRAAEQQGVTVEVVQSTVDRALEELPRRGATFDVVVLNPPRRGAPAQTRESIARIGAPAIVYVSSDPETLARDLDHFARMGYPAAELFPLDMAPHSADLDIVSVLRKGPLAAPPVIYVDDELLVIDKGAQEPVTAHSAYHTSAAARCRRLPLADTLLPLYPIEPGISGVCAYARSEAAHARWSTAFQQSARSVYLAAVKGITPAKGSVNRELRERGGTFQARTRYRRLAIAGGHSVCRVLPSEERPHQVRRHFAAIGHPVLGDERYGHEPTNRYFEERHGLDRSFLHLIRVELEGPDGNRCLFEAPLPGDLRTTLLRAGGELVLKNLEHKQALGELRSSPPSSRSVLGPISGRPDDAPQSTLIPVSERASVEPPELDESPRTIRKPIDSSGDDE